MAKTFVIIGLGNPGPEFENTRHNAGFMAVDAFAEGRGFPEFSPEKKFEALVAKQRSIIACKPQTFMNASGRAVKKLAAMHKGTRVVVAHDDMDLPLGKLKISVNRGSAGHKGVESVIKAIGNKHLVRLRIGMQQKSGKPKKPEKFVIGKLKPEEARAIKPAIQKAAAALDMIVSEGVERAMNEYNR